MQQESTEKHRLISSLDSFTLLGLSRLGEPEERKLALELLEERGHTPTPADAPRRLIEVCDELDQAEADLVSIFDRVPPSACLTIAATGSERHLTVAKIDGQIAAEQESDRRLAAR